MKASADAQPLLPKRLSLVAQTVESLGAGIRAGHWLEHLPGERELSRRLQVSRDTLRAALEELQRQGWIEVAQGRRRRIQSSRIVPPRGWNQPVIRLLSTNSFLHSALPHAFLIDALRGQLVKTGAAVEHHVSPACFSSKPASALEETVGGMPAAAWVVLGSRQPMQRWFIEQKLPCLIVGSCRDSIALPSIDADFKATCRHACGVLLRKGHRQIALVLPPKGFDGDADSEAGFREALADSGEGRLAVLRHDGSTGHLCALLDTQLRSASPPTGYLVARSRHVFTVVTHLMRRGLRIPQDVAVISRDDDPYLQAISPEVTRYSINLTRFANRVALAVRQLAETGFLPPRAIRLMPEFIPGGTVR